MSDRGSMCPAVVFRFAGLVNDSLFLISHLLNRSRRPGPPGITRSAAARKSFIA